MKTGGAIWTRVGTVVSIVVLLAVYSIVQYVIGLEPGATLYWSDGFWTLSALAVAWRSHRTARRSKSAADTLSWTYFAAASFSWALGMLVWDYYELVRGLATPFPGLSDFGFQGLAIFFIVGSLYYRTAAPTHQITIKHGLNIGIVLVTVLIISTLALHRSLNETTASFSYVSIALAYPVVYGSALLFAVSWLWTAVKGRRRRAYALMVAGLMFHTGVNIAYAASLLVNDYQTGLPLDVFWLIGFGLFYLGAMEADLSSATTSVDVQNSNVEEVADTFVQSSEAMLPGLVIMSILATTYVYKDALTDSHMTTILFAMLSLLLTLLVGREVWIFMHQRRVQNLLIRNILERKQAERSLQEGEARFRDFSSSASDWYWEMDENLRFSYFSDRFTEVTGVPQQVLLGKTRQDNGNPGATHEAWQEHLENLAHHRPFRNFFHPRTLPSGNVVWLSINGKPVFDELGQFKGYRGTGEDVTALHEMQEELVNAKDAAEKANQAKSEFLASMSHELRTPLNAILGFAQMLQFDPKTPLSAAQNEHVECILAGGGHLLELVNEVLDLARIEANQLDLTIGEVNANQVIADCVALTIPLGEPRDIAIIDKFSGGALLALRTDRLRFRQALLNLISNAVKYNKDGGTVSVQGRETDDGFLRISVRDTGVGIAEESRPNVFHMFNRLGVDPEIAREGTGIGLTVTKLLVERLAGRVGFESEEGVGSTFWIELPLATNETALIWTDALSTGVDAIDKDHQFIIELLNKVSESHVGDAHLDAVIGQLIDYTTFHFRREEEVMKVCGYPNLKEHLELHQYLRDQVNEFTITWNKNRDEEALGRLKVFLRDWLLNHIMKVDTTIAPYAHGQKRRIDVALERVK